MGTAERSHLTYARIMPRKRTGRPRRQRRLRRARPTAWHGWLLLLIGVLAAIVVVMKVLGPWPSDLRSPGPIRPLTAEQARASNAAVPIDARRRVTAPPFRFRSGPAAREQAVDCLATAAMYEAGANLRGQKAVIQVVLNRVRAPGFPKTICGVVYQGYERATGCQFSFTCDGSFVRRPIHLGWGVARAAARRALAGYVYSKIGGATHYHADWVVPYWRDSLTKIARVGTHLFYVRCARLTQKRAC